MPTLGLVVLGVAVPGNAAKFALMCLAALACAGLMIFVVQSALGRARRAVPAEQEHPMSDDLDSADGLAGKHGSARTLAEKALEAEAAGDDDKAEELFAAAEKADPDAVIAVLAEHADDVPRTVDTEEQDDDEIAAMSRTVEPESSAPSRFGVSGRGSGADTQE